MDLRTASEVFCESFAFGRSLIHPYLVSQHGPLLVMQDAPRKGKKGYRAAEIVAPGLPVRDVLEGIASFRPGRYFLSILMPGDKPDLRIKAAYKGEGFRLMRTEPMMLAETSEAPLLDCPALVRRVTTEEEIERLAESNKGRRPLRPEHLCENPPIRQYYAEIDGQIVGWVKSVHLRPECSWVGNMFVAQEHRRKGIAKALMSRMLQEDLEHGARYSLLLATHTGAMLYPALGYKQIGTLHLFAPPK